MAKHGIRGVIGGGSAEGGAVHKSMVDFQAAYARAGKQIELGERMALGFQFYLADSVEQGMKAAGKYYEENMKMFGELRLVRALTDEQIEIMRDPKRAPTAKLPRIEDAVKAGGFLVNKLPRCRRALKLDAVRGSTASHRSVGAEHAAVRGAGAVANSTARDVMHTFKDMKVAAAPQSLNWSARPRDVGRRHTDHLPRTTLHSQRLRSRSFGAPQHDRAVLLQSAMTYDGAAPSAIVQRCRLRTSIGKLGRRCNSSCSGSNDGIAVWNSSATMSRSGRATLARAAREPGPGILAVWR